ncbi:MAG: hypothetical protein ACI841_000209 [Planctomycetota bacterium]|jgi:hypothetical protein
MLRLWMRAILLLSLCAGVTTAFAEAALTGDAEDAYRRGDYTTASQLWQDEMSVDIGAAELARLSYNCGNASYREGDMIQAVAWYTAGLHYVPRDAELWYNLELARAEAGMEPADRGDLKATMRRVLGSMTATETDWGVLSMLALLAICLAGEALRGGLWGRMSLGAGALVALSLIPWSYSHWGNDSREMMIVSSSNVPARSEPRPDAKRLIDLEPGARYEWRDRLPGWVKIKVDTIGELWVPDKSVFELTR